MMTARFHLNERVSGGVPPYLYNCEFPLKVAMLTQRELAFHFPIWHRIHTTDEFAVTQEAGCTSLCSISNFDWIFPDQLSGPARNTE
jgi:hypothetical protein